MKSNQRFIQLMKFTKNQIIGYKSQYLEISPNSLVHTSIQANN